ncbi:hypothetical protein EW145_g1253 [Phellinidium pouzarii]|uniref:Pentacotripeptide-repeat region of PRORP domain-containing protein n=1 Tax=Phellinidium pouzarii TaxID=167371 RepID=A0A4S4LH03_9AGAM|nr:hypothetical protein EW145_g1253 [Phellinidium pouzarii]
MLKLCIANVSATARYAGLFRTSEQRAHFVLGKRSLTTLSERETGIINQLKETHEKIDDAIKRKDVDDLSHYVIYLRKLLHTLPVSVRHQVSLDHLSFTGSHVNGMLDIFSTRISKEDVNILESILRDCKDIYHVEVNTQFLQSALRNLVRTGRQVQAYALINIFRRPNLPFRPNSIHWQIVMKGLAGVGDIERVKEGLNIMKNGWPFPRTTHYQALLEAMLRQKDPPSVDEISGVLDEMHSLNLPYDPGITSLLERHRQELRELTDKYKTRRGPAITGIHVQAWLQELVKARQRGRSPFDIKLQQLRRKGFIPDERSLANLVSLSSTSTIEELQFLQEVLEVKSNVVVWSILIRNILAKTGIRNALEAYQAAKDNGIRPDAAMLHPLLRVLCSGRVGEPSEAILDRALELYKDLNVDTQPSDKHTTGRERKQGADTSVYNTLLRALASSSNARKYFPIALSLLENMRERDIHMDPMTSTSIAILLIRSASTFEEAFQAYEQLRSVKASALDAKGYAAVLHAFCSLPVRAKPNDENSVDKHAEFAIPPAKEYFKIVQDMRAQGFPKTSEVYTILLGRYAALATRIRDVADAKQRVTATADLYGVIEETRRHITLDAGFIPDAPLLNQLMDAYNRIGAMDNVLQVWKLLNSMGRVTNASVSVVFDACGQNRAPDTANAIFHDLMEVQFPLNRRNWNTWVECLCRLNRLDDAIKVVCHDMPAKADEDSQPDEETVRTLVLFASKSDRVEEVRSHIKMYLPTLLPDT